MKYKKIFAPGKIAGLELKNRLVMAPMVTMSFGPAGELTERTADYYAARAKGGVGLIICQSSLIMRESRAPFRCSIYDDQFIPGFQKVAQAIHENGAKAAFQVIHHGRALADYKALMPNPEEIRPLAPSPLSRLLGSESRSTPGGQATLLATSDTVPPEASVEDIERITEGFAQAARRIRAAGFDAVEIMAGHGYLMAQFLSPLFNRRSDRYGGGPENRARFVCEVIAAVKKTAGPDFPVILRISGSDFLPGGASIQETVQQVPFFIQAGADALHVSAGEQATTDRCYPSFLYPQGVHVSLAEEVKKVSPVPVITVGKIFDPALAEQILVENKADFVALGRPLLADPEWPNKVRDDRVTEIRPCIYCLNCLNFADHPYILGGGLTCSVNPAVLREKEFEPVKTAKPKKVLVVGGGPAGMEAARTLAWRGHLVELHERNDRLGGQWFIASRQKQKKEDYPRLLDYLVAGLAQAGVKVHLDSLVTTALVKNISPDAVVVAAGARPAPLNLPGADGPNVIQANDVILGRVKVGSTVIVVGGRTLGLEIADQLADEVKKVTLVTRRQLGRGVERNVYLALRNRLIQKGVYLYPHSPAAAIKEDGVYVVFNNDLVFLPAETVVLAVGVQSEDTLVRELETLVPEIHQIGDCLKPRDVMDAIREAAETARRI